jgi:hypothetical protein
VILVALAGPAWAGEIDAKGEVSAALHFGVAECGPAGVADCRWLDFQDAAVIGGTVDARPTDGVRARIDGRVRLHPLQGAAEVGDTSLGQRVQPLTIDVTEAWIAFEEALGPGVDVRVGQQRFAWGSALGVHPTDVASPYDLRDPTRFDVRLGAPAVALRGTHRSFGAELVWTPLFRPARMPAEVDLIEDAADLFDFSDMGAGDVDVGDFETRTEFPDGRVGFAGVGGRFTLAVPAFDVALMAWRGMDSLPQAGGEARIIGFQADDDRVDIGVPIAYPSLAVVGGDLRAPLPGDVGFWVEGAVMFPERVVVTASRTQLQALVNIGTLDEVPDPLPETVMQDGRPYPKIAAGFDRTFGRVMLAAQWIHGLPTERQAKDLTDSALLIVGWSVTDVVRIDGRGLVGPAGWLGGVDVSVLHRDAATLHVGATLADGREGSALADLRALSNVSAWVEAAF